MLNNYCVEAVCYNNTVNSSLYKPEDCRNNLCSSQTLSPTLPDVADHPHWFFSCTLFIGGAIHLLMSLMMLASFFVINTPQVNNPFNELRM